MKKFIKIAVSCVIIILGMFYLWRDWSIYNELFDKIFKSKLEVSLKKDNLYINNSPNNPWSYVYRGVTYQKNKMYKEALSDFLKAYDLNKNSFLFLNDISNTYLALGDTGNAYKYIFKVINRHPELKSNYFDLAIIYDYEYKSKEAIETYSKVIDSIKPDSDKKFSLFFSYKRRAIHYILQKEIDDAKNDIEYYLKENKNEEEALRIKKILSKNDKIDLNLIREMFKLNVHEAITLYYQI